MKLHSYFNRIEHIHSLIKKRGTGSPQQFAKRLNITERHLYRYIQFIKEDLKAPVEYSKTLQSYHYLEQGSLDLKWKKEVKKTD